MRRTIAVALAGFALAATPFLNARADTKAEIAALKARVEKLEFALISLSSEANALRNATVNVRQLDPYLVVTAPGGLPQARMTGINLQIVNGAANPDPYFPSASANGLGNLIIGYNGESPYEDPQRRGGSHLLVIGDGHTYTSWGGMVVGVQSWVTGAYSSVCGGQTNMAAGLFSSVGGGNNNIANGQGSSVSGGQGNTANGMHSWVSGGSDNVADGGASSVSGGYTNRALGIASSVSGGAHNQAIGRWSWVGGTFSSDF